MGITEEGIQGEQKLFKFLEENGYKFFQPDAIAFKDGKYVVCETKHQERYTPPPFEGHGLPKWQIDARIKFCKEFGIRCLLVVFEKGTNNIFSQYLDVLESGEHYDTKGLKPRRIYPLNKFNSQVKYK